MSLLDRIDDRFRGLKLRARIGIVLAALALSAVAGMSVLLVQMVAIERASVRNVEAWMPARSALAFVRADVTEAHLWLEEYLQGDLANDPAAILATLEGAIERVLAVRAVGAGRLDDVEFVEDLAALETQMRRFRGLAATRLERAGDQDVAAGGEIEAAFDDEFRRIIQLGGTVDGHLAARIENTRAVQRRAWTLAIVALVAALGVGLFVVFAAVTMMRRAIIGPLGDLERATQAFIADPKADLPPVHALNDDEIGALARAFQVLVTTIRRADAEQEAQRGALEAQAVELETRARESQAARAELAAGADVLLAAMERLAQGDLTVRIGQGAAGDMGRMFAGFDASAAAMSDLVARVRDSLARTAEAVVEISSAVEELAVTAEEQSRQIDSVVATVEETRTVAELNAGSLTQAAAAGRKTSSLAEGGKSVVDESAEVIRRIESVARAAADAMTALGRTGEEIGEVLGFIDDVADQTNLLAINAKIEAARVGAQGGGFQVIAQRVRELSDRTAGYTARIGDIVRRLLRDLREAADAAGEGVGVAAEGIGAAEDARRALAEIAGETARVIDELDRLAHAGEEQSGATREIEDNVRGIAEMVGESSRSFAQIAATSEALRRQTESLLDAVARFKV